MSDLRERPESFNERPRWHTRDFGEDMSARGVIAERMARRIGFAYIPPGIWADAGAIVEALREARFSLRRKGPKS